MLWLDGKENGYIRIGENILIGIVHIGKNRVNLVVKRPSNVPVQRREALKKHQPKERVLHSAQPKASNVDTEVKVVKISRKVNEAFLIGEDITVKVSDIHPNAVRIGIEAPQEMNIGRE